MRYVKVSSLGAYILLGDKEGDGSLEESPYNFILEAVLQSNLYHACRHELGVGNAIAVNIADMR